MKFLLVLVLVAGLMGRANADDRLKVGDVLSPEMIEGEEREANAMVFDRITFGTTTEKESVIEMPTVLSSTDTLKFYYKGNRVNTYEGKLKVIDDIYEMNSNDGLLQAILSNMRYIVYLEDRINKTKLMFKMGLSLDAIAAEFEKQ